jgi:hypothetical protein
LNRPAGFETTHSKERENPKAGTPFTIAGASIAIELRRDRVRIQQQVDVVIGDKVRPALTAQRLLRHLEEQSNNCSGMAKDAIEVESYGAAKQRFLLLVRRLILPIRSGKVVLEAGLGSVLRFKVIGGN